jgi:hypothetical protein
MRSLFAALASSLLCLMVPSWSQSEGLPLDHLTKRKILIEHTILTLSDDQLEESIALSTVTLTKQQWELHALLPGAIRGDRTLGLKKRIPSS